MQHFKPLLVHRLYSLMAGPARKLPQVDPRTMYTNVNQEMPGLYHRMNGVPQVSGRMGNGGPPGGPLLGRQGKFLSQDQWGWGRDRTDPPAIICSQGKTLITLPLSPY